MSAILRLFDVLWSRDTWGLALPPNPTVTTARTVVAPCDWLMRCGHVIYLGLGLAAESDGDDGEDGGGAQLRPRWCLLTFLSLHLQRKERGLKENRSYDTPPLFTSTNTVRIPSNLPLSCSFSLGSM
jgi:hypothetical protein